MATIDPFLQDAAFDPGALQAMSTAPLVGAFSWNDPGRLRVIRPNQQRVNGTGINAGSSSERPSGHAPGWPSLHGMALKPGRFWAPKGP
jgi:hypothetical protein